ncbi:MAG: GerMN domain-containing protein [Treponema sp.]|nr:GerMN domain-containing protein [Treponema sp.]
MANKKKKTGIGFAVWLIAAIVIIIVFLVKWETIHNNLIRAGILQGTITEEVEKTEPEKPKKIESSKKQETVTLKVQEEKKPEVKVETPKQEAPKPEVKPEVKEEEKVTKPVEKVEEPKPVPANTKVNLCFVMIDANGSVNYKTVTRTTAKTDSPLTNAINQLLEGPSFQSAAEKNCTTLIPNGTKLLGASVKDGVATLNFNDAFEFNPDGIEGYLGQLKQVINTATEFSSVKSVQFLINGQKKEYLGSDGVWIGTPLGRGSF